MQRRNDRVVQLEESRYIADHVPGSQLIVLDGQDHWPWIGDAEAVAVWVEEFITGKQALPRPDRVHAAVLFSDMVGSTAHAARVGEKRWRELLERYTDSITRSVEENDGRLVKTTGDGCVAVFDGPVRAVQAAVALRDAAREAGVEVRTGVHSGQVELIGLDIGGMTVHVAARVEAAAGPNDILVTSDAKDLMVGSTAELGDVETRKLRGLPGTWSLWRVLDRAARKPPGT
jgi:class 3 adenylate cyclase